MVDTYVTTPTGKIVNRGEPVICIEKKLAESAKAGMLAVVGTTDYDVKKADGTKMPFGWIGYEHTDYKFRPTSYETAYVVGDMVGIVAGGNIEVYAILDGSQTIVAGDLLADAGNGMLVKYNPECTTADTKTSAPLPPVAKALEGKVTAENVTARIHVASLI